MISAVSAPLHIQHVGSPSSVSSFRKQAMKKTDDHIQVNDLRSEESKKAVAYSKRVRAKKVRSHYHYSQEERFDTWYSPVEYAEIKNQCVETLKRFHNDPGFADCDEFSSRGLEIRTKAAAQTRKANKAFALQAVLYEQELQRIEGIKDPERIREAYLKISRVSQSVANFFASRDWEEVSAFP
jgi:tRNA/tmRNA/rRNA uracil-C5-methylase (TrmA/RlmC/RlmD family)